MKTNDEKNQTHTPGVILAILSAKLRNLAINNKGLAGTLHELADAAWTESCIQKDLVAVAKEALDALYHAEDSMEPLR